eukprot:624971-Pyramimonas_sp.AAC.1
MASLAIILCRAEDGVPSKTGAVDESLFVNRQWLAKVLLAYAELRPKSGRPWDFDLLTMRAKFLEVRHQLELQR